MYVIMENNRSQESGTYSTLYNIQLVSCDISTKYLSVFSALEYIHAIDAYIFCDSLWSVMFSGVLYIFIDIYVWSFIHFYNPVNFIIQSVRFVKYAMKWFSNPHLSMHLVSDCYVQYAHYSQLTNWMLYNVLYVPDSCDLLFSIITYMS